MERQYANLWLALVLVSATSVGMIAAKGQGTVTFDAHPNWLGTDYSELGMAFRLVIPQGSDFDYMGITYGAGNTPRNGTPFMLWFRINNPSEYIELSLTNGTAFGLSSVQLADPTSPSLSPVAISFVGFRMDGSTVTNSFTTPGNGATTFQSYQFGSEFASGLSSVEILSTRWAMDNLAFKVPEPCSEALLALGLLALRALKRCPATKPH